MMKSALIKDLYTEIVRLKQEVYAATEKNGIYIPRDRYLHEEDEKKKALVERAFERRSELENATSDVSGLFAKIEREDKIEDGNQILVQKFQPQLTHQLELLHKTVAVSVMQQEHQLKEMEEDMQSFVSTKAEATEELRGRVAKLKTMYGSGIKALDDLAGELDVNFQSTFGNLNSEVSKHSSALEHELLQRLM